VYQETKEIAGQVQVSLDITRGFLSDILVTAFDGGYGGSWYWARPHMQTPEQGPKFWLEVDGDYWMAVHIIESDVSEGDSPRAFYINHHTLLLGLNKLFQPGVLPKRGDIRSAVIAQEAGNIDSDAADVIVQLACFGELVYG
jgi:hypothetical protein